MSSRKWISIAVDGGAGTGKSTLTRNLARMFNLYAISSGRIYRLITLDLIRKNKVEDLCYVRQNISNTEESVRRLSAEVSDADIHTLAVDKYVSLVAEFREIRIIVMNIINQLIAEKRKECCYDGIIIDGRDIGTIIMPDADLKIYMVADIKVRSERRRHQYDVPGNVLDQLRERDRKDTERKYFPLKKASNAEVLDTTHMDIGQTLATAAELVRKVIAKRSSEAAQNNSNKF